MTRLFTDQISHIPETIDEYNQELKDKTGCGLVGLANHALGTEYETAFLAQKRAAVVPVTVGEGIIQGFSKSVAAILEYMGFEILVTNSSDVKGIKEAYQKKADILLMADDDEFIALNLEENKYVDNNWATARAYVNALELMVGGLKDRTVVVQGLGPIGREAVRALIEKEARIKVYDVDEQKMIKLTEEVESVEAVKNPEQELKHNKLILEATPVDNTIQEDYIDQKTYISAPGVPLGVCKTAISSIEDRLIHDPLQLGVSLMAAGVL
ncbi:3-methylornithyl-N6-L-lysine dehydrogenase PylD [Acetohalobium arabaticum]|uniref:Pyrrolysine biosynthesis protein PylD N-terminal domain-containing protein n=1 Tax=Acetohalobium arabaticum (strain ATCC 49924 / DSM 5501 / Z-7288) TaxID=574087 RepID=D9QUB4_ACEAZ|nr:3-methylornithyl-N6-L-lysine dehydrogenase PylD [Acetohalobium arabaticum]ADL11907.1 conserved hypothetical protein [Acetohalobium arabaticum DSM 5501]